MDVREKLVELIENGVPCPDGRDPFGEYCDTCRYLESADCSNERLADYLISHGVTVQEHGYWENANGRPKTYIRKCSVCGKEAYFCGRGCSYKFCPNCGSKMRLEE